MGIILGKLNKTGLVFTGIAMLLIIFSIVTLQGTTNQEILLPMFSYFGLGLPFLSALYFRTWEGCGIKETGCETSGTVGMMVGFIILLLFYYGFGCLVQKIYLKVKNKT